MKSASISGLRCHRKPGSQCIGARAQRDDAVARTECAVSRTEFSPNGPRLSDINLLLPCRIFKSCRADFPFSELLKRRRVSQRGPTSQVDETARRSVCARTPVYAHENLGLCQFQTSENSRECSFGKISIPMSRPWPGRVTWSSTLLLTLPLWVERFCDPRQIKHTNYSEKCRHSRWSYRTCQIAIPWRNEEYEF